MKINKWFLKIHKLGQKGFSLIEVMIAAGIGTIVSAGIATVFIFALEQFTVLVEQNATEESLLWAAYNTRAYLSQAVDIRVQDPPMPMPLNVGAAPNYGRILRQFDSTTVGAGTFNLIAGFQREVGDGSGGGASIFRATSIWLVTPSATAVGNSQQPWGGILFFSEGGAPGLGDLWFDRISYFALQDVECTDPNPALCNGFPIKSATVVIRARYFKTVKKDQWFYRTSNPMPAGIGGYRDIEMTVKVGFRNNILLGAGQSRVGGTTAERLHGGLYFFRMPLPPLKQ